MDDSLPSPFDKHTRRALRHNWQDRILWVSTILTTILVIIAIWAIVELLRGDLRLGDLSGTAHNVVAGAIALMTIAPTLIISARVIRSAKPRATGALVTPAQFPEVYELVSTYATLFGMPRAPKVIFDDSADNLSQSTARLRSNTITLHTDLLEAPRLNPEGTLAVLRFALAREFGLLRDGRRNFGYQFVLVIAQGVPYLKTVLARAEEYTADRWGALIAPEAAADYCGFLAVGKGLFAHTSLQELARSAGHGGWAELAPAWTMAVPPLPWRVRAFAELGVCAADTLEALSPCTPGQVTQDLLRQRYELMGLKEPRTQGAFWFPPKHRDDAELARICPAGTVADFDRDLP